jgi:hypothetical protein
MVQSTLDSALDAALDRHVVELRNGATVTLFRDQHIVRTKSGQKLHKSHPGSSVTYCGHWLKVESTYFKVIPTNVTPAHVMCEKCF